MCVCLHVYMCVFVCMSFCMCESVCVLMCVCVCLLLSSKLYVQWCRLVNSERQYVSTLRGVEEHFLPQLEGPDVPGALRGQSQALFSNWSSLCTFHTQYLLPAMEGALTQTLQQQDCFIKYVSRDAGFVTL